MAVEKEKVEQLLEENGLDTTGADNYTNFADEDSLKNVLTAMKTPSYSDIEEIKTKNPDLFKKINEYGDIRASTIQSEFDKFKLAHAEKKEADPAKKKEVNTDEEPEWAKTIQEKLAALEKEKEEKKAEADFNDKVKKTADKYLLKDEYQIKLLKGQLKKDSTDEDIDKLFKQHVDYLNKNKISLSGDIQAGKKVSGAESVKKMMDKWKANKEKEKALFNKKK